MTATSAAVPKTNHALTAALLAIIPGFGQFYNKQWVKGIIFAFFLFCFFLSARDLISHGIWGLTTLGTELPRDNSIFLLAEGIVVVLMLLLVLTLWGISIHDAYACGKTRDEGKELYSLKRQYKNLFDRGFPYLMIAPGFVLLVFVVIFPIVFGFALAFTSYNLYNTPPAKLVTWVGFKTFTNLFTLQMWRSTFFDVLGWTVVWTVLASTFQCAVGVLLAILVNQKDLKFRSIVRTIFILPWAVPGFVTILVFAGMFNDSFGVINGSILPMLGVDDPPRWLIDPFWTKTALIMMQTWLGFPFVFAMTTGVLQAIPEDLYEAATMDGATSYVKLKTITLPLVLYSIAPIIITQYTFNFNNFNIIYLFNGGGPAVAGSQAGGTDILVSWIYKLTMSSSQYNIASAITILLSIFVVSVALWQFRRSNAFKNEDMM